MKRLIKKIRHLTSKDYQHHQYVILSFVVAIALLAYAFNRYILNRSVIVVNVAYPNVTLSLDGQTLSPTQLDQDSYKFVTIPGKHTLTIQSGDEINHRQVITARAGFTLELTPALTIAPNPESDVVGDVSFISQSSDNTQLFYLGRNDTMLVLYDIPTRIRTAISDPVFRNIVKLKWSADHHSVITQDSTKSWYFFDFSKRDFINADFHLIANASVFDVEYDPQHERVGLIEFRDNKPVFAVADIGLKQKTVLIRLDDLQAPHISWAPNGRLVAFVDEAVTGIPNLFFYDLAEDKLIKSNLSDVTRVSFAPDSTKALVESGKGSHPTLKSFDIVATTATDLGRLAVPGATVWQNDSQHLTALISNSESAAQLSIISVADATVNPYRTSLAISKPIETIFLSDNADTLYFVSDKRLYSFPLILHN